MEKTTPRVLGLDLSLTSTGAADIYGGLWTIKTKTADGDRRLLQIMNELLALIKDANGDVDLAVVEDLPTHAMAAGITGMVHGTVRTALLQTGIPYILVTPATLKTFATGKGNSPKPELRMALYKRAGLDVKDDNQVDAYWLRAIGMHHLGAPLLSLPQSHLRALDKINWTYR